MGFTPIEITTAVFSSGFIGGLIGWLRGRSLDRANVKKTYADAEKTLAESVVLRSKADMQVGHVWVQLASELKGQLERAHKRIDHLEKALMQERDECDKKMNQLREDLTKQLNKIS